MDYTLQSVLFKKSKFSVKEAKSYLKKKGYKVTFYGKQYDETANFYRFRQAKPKKNVKYFIKTSESGVVMVFYYQSKKL